ncbi:LysR family transcriptional regulator [uncultured Sneathiella sp.]|uniref:LysR family transcriptional regulator n=1 Tax=uncultured Sneathiella sp. TaxID=879315 RepID=UPI00259A1BE7|nr:LysR family transcriptional regulator [uncultured Sneathiella sp.]
MSNLKLIQLQVFSKVIELQSFSAAAEYFGVTQPAVTFHVRELENVLGVSLIERSSRKSKPTPAGKELLKHSSEIDDAVSRMHSCIARYRSDADE